VPGLERRSGIGEGDGGSLALLTDLYQLTMACGYWKAGTADREAVFHLTFRRAPFGGGYAIAAGIAHALDYLRGLRFTADDLVYLALWLKLLETELSIPSDGSAEDTLSSLEDASGWSAKLRAWGRGKLTDAELAAGAQNRVEHTEASFYIAMSKRARGDQSAYQELARVARSETVNLVEIGIARDVVALHAGAETGIRLPPSADLP